jgi:magnesium transporter
MHQADIKPRSRAHQAAHEIWKAESGPHRLETAGHRLAQRVPIAHADDLVGSVLSELHGRSYDSVDAVYVVDESKHLEGLIRLRDLLGLPVEARIGDVMQHKPPLVHPEDDQERVALLAIKHSLAAVPVVDGQSRLMGVVPAQTLIKVLRREHMEDLHLLAGIYQGQAQAHEALEASPAHRTRDRLPWLFVGLLGSMIATLIMAHFEAVLQARVAVAFFVPAIVYLADAIGTQTEAIAVRFLSVNHFPLRQLLAGELTAGLLIGLSLGAVILPVVWLSFGDFSLALAVALAVIAAAATAATVGLIFPWLLHWLGKDPALGSGPVATIIQDVLSLLIYFLIVAALVM